MKKKSNLPTYEEVDGDAIKLFFESESDAAFIHGANCMKIMGAGIANQVRNQIAPLFYLDQYDPRTPTQRLGSYSALVVGQVKNSIKIAANLYTQYQTGANFDLNAFHNALTSFALSIPDDKKSTLTIFLPKIGCGIGGATWEEVEPTVKECLKNFNVVVVNYKAEDVIKEN